MEFPYKPYRLRELDVATGLSLVLRPVIPIRLSAAMPGSPIYYEAMIDSGADWCLFHAEAGEGIGLKIESGQGQYFAGVEGVPMLAYFHRVQLIVGEIRVSIRAGFVRDFGFPYGLLGQAGFFDQFVVSMSRTKTRPYILVEPIQ